ncbi:MAG: hypothetical protein Kow00108_22980 [Calditrichia bacterium]
MDRAVLIVDDEEIIVSLLKEYLETFGYKIYTAADGKEGLDLVKEKQDIELVLSDVKMDKMSGIELLKMIKEYRKDLPVIIITGFKTLDNTIEALRYGAVDYISKPFNLSDVKKIIDRILSLKQKQIYMKEINQFISKVEFSYEFKARDVDSEAISRYLSDILVQYNICPPGDATQYYIVFNEAIVNGLEHGCLELESSLKQNDLDEKDFVAEREKRLKDDVYGSRKLCVSLKIEPDQFEFVVEDDGKGFDYQPILKTLADPVPNFDAFGRGFMFMKHTMDEIKFNEKGNRIILIKKSNEK